MHRIEIPNSKPANMRQQAGQIVVDALLEAGVSPRTAHKNLMMQQMVAKWGRGEWTRGQFIHACRNLLILNPSLHI